jgi:hypothetical protein
MVRPSGSRRWTVGGRLQHDLGVAAGEEAGEAGVGVDEPAAGIEDSDPGRLAVEFLAQRGDPRAEVAGHRRLRHR